eukprot:CAMPEP_0202707636 /NCGR_PEP_ID=MMETSP1385-20130828/19934_1 /ASSEMBLY_ACC=CAM_ASM_000861 /TAXON_ID=933848 /ORGANISM="Elphidium margaritaceum" /LENGTH=969 /DNA_ID=CAMNT_0049366387 /DNA_START=21 /DNA_END=2930 /DNA_ORIENTATION=+
MTTNHTDAQVEAAAPLLPKSGDNSIDILHPSDSDNDHYARSSIAAVEQHSAPSKNKLGTINGCYVPCLLNIMGIILFERLGWGVGQLGVSGVFLVFVIAEFQAILTVLSLSAIVTNGTMRGGGSYYMISRTLGPEFGGSIGLLFYAAYCVGVAFYCTGFAEEIVETWHNDVEGSAKFWLVIMYASSICGVCLAIALAGARWFTKINVFLFFWQFLAIFISLIAVFFRGTFHLENQTTEACSADTDEYFYHYAWTWSHFTEMWSFVCSTGNCASFAITFGVLFPAATGIMEGANLSGDLANPTYSIPVGTLSAIATAICVYVALIFSFAGAFNQCTLRHDTTIMQESAWGDVGTYLVVAGVMISASSSALGSLFGGSRVLQAIARDQLFPYMSWFEYGSAAGDEPRTCVLLTWVLAQALIFIGSINAIAPISTSFFCLSYCTVNFSCFLLEISGTPNFRPSFQFYSWHTCLLGTVSNLAVMFFVDWRFALVALVCEIAVFIYLLYRAPQTLWGDVTAALIFHQVRKYLLRLDTRKAHSKTWRPSILLLADDADIALIDFCNNLKKGGLYVIGSAVVGDFAYQVETVQKLRADWIQFVDDNALKAFPQIAVASTVRAGYENLILLSGLGAMRPNTIVLPLLRLKLPSSQVISSLDRADNNVVEEEEKKTSDSFRLKALVQTTPAEMDALDYTKLCRNILRFKRNIVMTANMHSLDSELVVSERLAQAIEEQYASTDLLNNKVSDERTSNIQQPPKKKTPKTKTTAAAATAANYWTFASKKESQNIGNEWVDIWLFAEDYSLNLDAEHAAMDRGFPMLIMQFAHILLTNKVWDKAAGLRVFLLVGDEWSDDDQQRFSAIVKDLRLDVDSVVVLKQTALRRPSWQSIIADESEKQRLLKYYQSLNETIVSLSSQTYFTFLRMPDLPPIDSNDEDMNHNLCTIHFEALYALLQNMPPTALICTGETLPVISMDI